MYFGTSGMKNNYTRQMCRLFDSCESDVPRFIGETGIPMDMNRYFHTSRGDSVKETPFQLQTQALDCVITACERNLLPYCLWNYTPENIEGKGDFWNREDLSIFALQHCDGSIYGGARALRAFVRPGAIKVAGTPIKSEFDLSSGTYTLVFIPSETCDLEVDSVRSLHRQTEIFIPNLFTSEGSSHDYFAVSLKCGSAKWVYVLHFAMPLVLFQFTRMQFRSQNSNYVIMACSKLQQSSLGAAVRALQIQWQNLLVAYCSWYCLCRSGVKQGVRTMTYCRYHDFY